MVILIGNNKNFNVNGLLITKLFVYLVKFCDLFEEKCLSCQSLTFREKIDRIGSLEL